MIRSIGFMMFVFAGCAAENPNYYNGGTIWYSPDDELPEAPPVCMEQEDPVEWEPVNCVENSSGECCYWREQKFNSAGTKLLDCRHDWCYNKYECKWHHVISRCEGGQ